ncbi:MAG: hypothetical protein ACI4TE_00130 [Alphaproteobacteria bacterium]
MFKIVSAVYGIMVLFAASVCAEEVSSEQIMQSEFQLNNEQINEIFQEKIQKISARLALPEEMRSLLIKQADEIRQFDLDTLKNKMDLKVRHAKERDEMKERLRQDAQNRVKWQMEEEERFQKNKTVREQAEQAVRESVKPAEPAPAEQVPASAAESDPAEQAPAPAAESAPAEQAPAPAAESAPAEQVPNPAAESAPAEQAPAPAAESAPAEQ